MFTLNNLKQISKVEPNLHRGSKANRMSVEVEITPSIHEIRISATGQKIDGKTFAGVMIIYLNPDERIVRAALAKDQIAKAIPILGRYYAAHGFKEAIFSHNADKDSDTPTVSRIDLTKPKWGYNPKGDLCRVLVN
jgi:hypothetical protein